MTGKSATSPNSCSSAAALTSAKHKKQPLNTKSTADINNKAAAGQKSRLIFNRGMTTASLKKVPNMRCLSTKRNRMPSQAVLAEIKGIPEHFEIQLIDPETNEKYIFDRQKKEI